MAIVHPIISELIEAGAWPVGEFNFVSEAAVRSVAPDEERICLSDPLHFRTVELEVSRGSSEFWQKFGALSEIDPSEYLIIGDFGLGSDAPIVIGANPNDPDPKVLRLQWHCGNHNPTTHWVTFFERLSDFAALLYQEKKNAE